MSSRLGTKRRGDAIGGIMALVFTVIILAVLDIYAFWPMFLAIAGGWAVPLMIVILIVEGAGIFGEMAVLGG
jgi:hypothetical protein